MTARMLFAASVLALLSCGAPPTSSDGAATEEGVAAPVESLEGPPVVIFAPRTEVVQIVAPASQPIDPNAECLIDDVCDNGVFCDGPEVCAPNQRCVPGQPIQCPQFMPMCDEDSDTCM